MDYIDLIFKSEIMQQLTTGLKTIIMFLVQQNQLIYFLVWATISILIALWLSGKMVSKALHVFTLAVLIFFSLKYIGLI